MCEKLNGSLRNRRLSNEYLFVDVINVWQWGQFILLNSLKPVVVFQCFSIHFLNSKVSQPYMENLILLWLLKMIPLCSAHSSTPCEFDFFCVAIWRYQPIVKLITKIERQWWSSENQSPLDGPVREYMYQICNLSFIFES